MTYHYKKSIQHLAKGMSFLMDFFQTGQGNMGIHLRRGQLGMSQDCLDRADICPIIQHANRHAVPEQMT